MRTKEKQSPALYKKIILFFGICVFAFFLVSYAHKRPEPASVYVPTDYLTASEIISYDPAQLNHIPDNPFPTLSVPTYITKVKDTYFIVDCYNNQVIYHDNLTDPLYQWQIMTNDIAMGHTLASDGTVYLIDDTENNRILVMEESVNENGQPVFIPTQEFINIGNRPHYILYDEYTDTFYAWSSMSGEMYLFRHTKDNSRMYLTETLSIPSLNGVYVRSFTIVEDRIYFVSGNSSIIEADLYTFEVKKEYPVPDCLAGMIQLTLIDDYYYITISTDASGNQDCATIIRTKDLADLASGNYEDIYDSFIGGGTPYYITRIDDFWYLTEHRIPGHSIWQFRVQNDSITDITTLY